MKIILIGISFASCEKDEQVLLYGDEPNAVTTKLYVSNGLTPLNSFNAKVHNDRLASKTTFTGDEFSFPILSSMTLQNDVKVMVEPDTLAENAFNETQIVKIKSLPQEFIEIVNKEVIIKKGERRSNDSIKFALKNLDKLIGTYIFGVSIKSISDNSIGISDNMRNVIYKITATESYISVGREPLVGVKALDSSLFKFITSSYNDPLKMIDNDYSTSWNSGYGKKELIIDLGGEFGVTGFSMSPYYSTWSDYLPKNMDIYASNDNKSWKLVEKCKMLTPLGSVSKPGIQYVKFRKTNMKFLKFYFNDYYGYGVGIGELKIYE